MHIYDEYLKKYYIRHLKSPSPVLILAEKYHMTDNLDIHFSMRNNCECVDFIQFIRGLIIIMKIF